MRQSKTVNEKDESQKRDAQSVIIQLYFKQYITHNTY